MVQSVKHFPYKKEEMGLNPKGHIKPGVKSVSIIKCSYVIVGYSYKRICGSSKGRNNKNQIYLKQSAG